MLAWKAWYTMMEKELKMKAITTPANTKHPKI